ncbi:MAG: hypothetical protein AB9828_06785 [Sphaerochaetaceae bacterium]
MEKARSSLAHTGHTLEPVGYRLQGYVVMRLCTYGTQKNTGFS